MSVSASERRPGFYGEHNLSTGSSSTAAKARKVYIWAEYVAAGTATDGAVTGPISNFSEATTFFGSGSNGEYITAKALAQEGGSTVAIYLVGQAEAAGGTAAISDLTFATNATSAGTGIFRVGCDTFTVAITNGWTPTQAAAEALVQWNALQAENKPPFTGSAALGVFTLTANNKCLSLGHGATDDTGMGLEVVSWDVAGMTVSWDDERVGGSTAGAGTPTLTNALAALTSIRSHYLVPSIHHQDATSLTAVQSIMTHVREKSAAESMLGSVAVFGNKNAAATSVSDVDDIDSDNAERGCMVCCEASAGWEPVAAVKSAVARAYEDDAARPMNGVVLTGFPAPAATDRYSGPEQNTLMAGGCTPLVAADDSNVAIVRMISMRMDVVDPMDITIIETMDEYRERCQIAYNRFVNRLKLKDDGQQVYTNTCTTPSAVLDILKGVGYEMEREDKLQGIDLLLSQFTVATRAAGGITANVPTAVVPGLHVADVTFNLVLTLPAS